MAFLVMQCLLPQPELPKSWALQNPGGKCHAARNVWLRVLCIRTEDANQPRAVSDVCHATFPQDILHQPLLVLFHSGNIFPCTGPAPGSLLGCGHHALGIKVPGYLNSHRWLLPPPPLKSHLYLDCCRGQEAAAQGEGCNQAGTSEQAAPSPIPGIWPADTRF